MKHIVIGTLAHVDAGKTTLNESLLFASGTIRKIGRVDHKDSFLDYDSQERERGITIYMKQARFSFNDCLFTLVDTPGHVDFSAEMERTLRVLDYAILVISATDGVQPHTITIWKLLEHYHIPVFIFINKMDIAHREHQEILNEIQQKLSLDCLDFQNDNLMENIALYDEVLLDMYMRGEDLPVSRIQEMIQNRNLFPCLSGSALKSEGINKLLTSLSTYSKEKQYPNEFGAFAYKVSMDDKGNRLTHLKLTGGSLLVKQVLDNGEKVDQIRLYNGNRFESVNEVQAGTICCIKGLTNTKPGDFFGIERHISNNIISAFMSYRITLLDPIDTIKAYQILHVLQDEDPQLHITYHNDIDEIRILSMGDIQNEVLERLILDRFHMHVKFEFGRIAYKETIAEPIEGIGHFEPLRHYAEVHIVIEPLPIGSGIVYKTSCSSDRLSKNYQNQILSALESKEHIGVLTGSPLTDLKITLVDGKAHEKHTEGGDFLQAAYRAVRHGMKRGKSILLEPYYQFQITLDYEYVSRITYDLDTMHAKYTVSDTSANIVIEGSAPIRLMQGYPITLSSLTKGSAHITCFFKDYEPCINAEEIIQAINYDSEADIENPTGSIFCKQGSGFYVPWNEVTNYMHLPPYFQEIRKPEVRHNKYHISEEELNRVIERSFGPVKTRLYQPSAPKETTQAVNTKPSLKPCLLVDGYNIIHAWPKLKEIADTDLYNARNELINYMNNYQGFKNNLLILVFDAYRVKENPGKICKQDNIYVVYTKESETADSYIERVTHDLSKHYQITVATSDGMEQLIIMGNGARRMSARELILDYEALMDGFRKDYNEQLTKSFNMALSDLRNK